MPARGRISHLTHMARGRGVNSGGISDRPLSDSALCAAAETLAALSRPVGAARLLGAALRRFWPGTPPYARERAAALESVLRGELGEAFDLGMGALEGASPAEFGPTSFHQGSSRRRWGCRCSG